MGAHVCSLPASDKDEFERRQQFLLEVPGNKKHTSTGSLNKGVDGVARDLHPAPARAPERGPHAMALLGRQSEVPTPQQVGAPPTRECTGTAPPIVATPVAVSAQASSSASASASSKLAKVSPSPSSSSANRVVKLLVDAITLTTSSEIGSNNTQSLVTPQLIPELGGSAGGKDWQADEFIRLIRDARCRHDDVATKRLLKQVAESNYLMRAEWKIPRTFAVSAQKCSSKRLKVKGKPKKVSFSYLDTADAVRRLARDRRRRICALNFANGEHVGGGYKNGSQAQEEDLCRRIPSLYTSLHNAKRDGAYPFGPCTCVDPTQPAKYSQVLYTQGCVIARASEAEGFALLKPDDQVMLSLVTAAAPNINFTSEIYDPNLMHETVKNIFIAPIVEEPQINTLVLGAWGCGGFGGDPEQISELFMRVLTAGLGRLYSEVHFAVPEGRNADVFRAALDMHNITVDLKKL